MYLVSIIVPVYGVEMYIEKCARSIFSQTYQNLDIIFVDDCSQDNSIQILNQTLKDYPNVKNKTRILSYSSNLGLAGARKFGLQHAVGDYVLQIDSDDYVDTNMVSSMIEVANSDNADIVFCDYYDVISEKKHLIHVNPSLNNIDCAKEVLYGRIQSYVWNKLIKRSLYVDNDIYPTIGVNIYEDMSVMYRLLFFSKKISYIPKPLYFYIKQRPGAYTSSSFSQSKQYSIEVISQQMVDFSKENGVATLFPALNFWITKNLLDILKHGNYESLNLNTFQYVSICNYLKKSNFSFISSLLLFSFKFKSFFVIKLMRNLYNYIKGYKVY